MPRKIQNGQKLAATELRRKALEIAEAGLRAIDSALAVKTQVRLEGASLFIKGKEYSLKRVDRLFVVGVGKCSLDAATALEEILGERIADGVVLDKREGSLRRMRAFQGDHPFASERNAKATKEIIELLESATEEDLVLFVISGGGSVLLCQSETLTCKEESEVVRCLFEGGAAIEDINTLRKHLSLARGGYLAQYAYPARVISLIFSDVPGNDLSLVASGPTVQDKTSKEDAKAILERYKLKDGCGLSGDELLETPKEEKYFEKVENILFLSNETALSAMKETAESLGYEAGVQTAELVGEARLAGASIARELEKNSPGTALLYGGETTVVVRKKEKGGRNLELGLSALPFLKEGELVFAFASDGQDNTEAAGALCDMLAQGKAKEQKADPGQYLTEHRSFEFFEKTGDLVFMGPTGSNVSDLVIALKDKA